MSVKKGRAFSPPFSAYKYRGREEAQGERLERPKKKRQTSGGRRGPKGKKKKRK